MTELKDPGIKLFGMSIALPENRKVPFVSGEESDDIGSDFDRSSMVISCLDDEKVSRVVGEDQEAQKESMVEKPTETKQQDLTSPVITENSKNQETVPESNENPVTPSIEEDKTENDQSDTNDSEQKTPKKPDKILPCPRCSSMDTKFCYYNNYNVNQPRHFCKSCQRYWTSGGTMRNVPVGAGRRKNKNSNSSCRHITISEVLQVAQIDLQNAIHNPHVKTNETVLSFGSNSRLSESIASVLNLADKKAPNGFYKIQQGNGENGDDCSSGSSVTTSNSTENGSRNGLQDPTIRSMNGLPSQVPCLPGVPWPYPWNSAVPIPAFCPPGFPISFYPPPYWNSGFPGTWAIPCLAPVTPNTPPKSTNSDPNSPILGKHWREGGLINPINPELKEPIEKNSQRSVLIPKTLRIDDPDEAAKSSIWATLGIKNDSINRGGIFKGFESNGEKKIHVAETPPALRANPAAFSRSLTFQES